MATELTGAVAGSFVPPRRAGSRKGDNGRVLVVGGGGIYHGAPVLSSLAALRSGADLVYTAVPPSAVLPARAASPALIVVPMADEKLTRGSARKLLGRVPPGADSAAVGMGMAVADRAALALLVRGLADADVRLCLDAAALVPEVLPEVAGRNCVVTPHAGEFRRLFGEAPPDEEGPRAEAAAAAASRHRVAVLLKGRTDVISDGSSTYLCRKDAPAMTVGGTGDVLAGLAAGILARNRSPVEAAAAAAYFNGLAGASAQARVGLHMAPTDLCDELPSVMMRFDRTAG